MFIRKSKLSFWAEFGLDLTPKGDHSLTLETLTSKFEFSFVASIHFLQKKWGEIDKISSKFILPDHVRNSHDHSHHHK